MNYFRYITDCINAPGFEGMSYGEAGDAINAMKAVARPVTRKTFLAHTLHKERQSVEAALGYVRYPRQGLTMAGDWHVSYFKSTFKDRPVYYFTHSGVEYIFAQTKGS